MSAAVVIPKESNISWARAKARSRTIGGAGGIACSIRLLAASTKIPLGARPALRSLPPPRRGLGGAGAALDRAPARRRGGGGTPRLANPHAVGPAGMAVDPLEPDRPVADHRVDL